jgi:hypothetical protein
MAQLVLRFNHVVPNRRRVNLRSSPPLEKYAAWAEFQRTFDTKISFALYLSASSFSARTLSYISSLCSLLRLVELFGLLPSLDAGELDGCDSNSPSGFFGFNPSTTTRRTPFRAAPEG